MREARMGTTRTEVHIMYLRHLQPTRMRSADVEGSGGTVPPAIVALPTAVTLRRLSRIRKPSPRIS